MRAETNRTSSLALAWGLCVLAACSGDHDLLAQKPTDDDALDADKAETRSGSGGNRRPDPPPREAGDPEPAGAFRLTLVNGMVDGDGARFCWTVGEPEKPLDRAPEPPGNGLGFGSTWIVDSLPPDVTSMALHPYLVRDKTNRSCASLLGSIAGVADGGSGDAKDSASDAAVDGASDAAFARDGANDGSDPDTEAGSPRLVSLPVIPAGTLDPTRSYLAVTTGCNDPWLRLDGQPSDGGSTDGSATDGQSDGPSDGSSMDGVANDEGPPDDPVCGDVAGAGIPGLMLVRLSRRVTGKVGFQLVHASAATPDAALQLEQPASGTAVLAVSSVGLGQIAPRDQPALVSSADLGTSPERLRARVTSPDTAFRTFTSTLGSLFVSNHIEPSELVGSSSFSFVLIGARPGQAVASPWYPFRVVLVRNAPALGDGG
ncbi:MAG TPA: hypothetical protein VJT73_09730 [Polyangiaceae bacterium]|nr:hypothetical protein [Polyangiaceae bacterium]